MATLSYPLHSIRAFAFAVKRAQFPLDAVSVFCSYVLVTAGPGQTAALSDVPLSPLFAGEHRCPQCSPVLTFLSQCDWPAACSADIVHHDLLCSGYNPICPSGTVCAVYLLLPVTSHCAWRVPAVPVVPRCSSRAGWPDAVRNRHIDGHYGRPEHNSGRGHCQISRRRLIKRSAREPTNVWCGWMEDELTMYGSNNFGSKAANVWRLLKCKVFK